MPLTEEQLVLIRSSFDVLREDLRPRSVTFYEKLFNFDPGLRGMFRDDLAGQGMRFMATLSVIVDNLHDPSSLEERYADLGRGHAGMGVRVRDFEPMGRALIESLREALGDQFTPATETAWILAYEEFSQAIIKKGEIPE